MRDTIKELDNITESISQLLNKTFKESWNNKAKQNFVLARLENVKNSLTAVRIECDIINRQ